MKACPLERQIDTRGDPFEFVNAIKQVYLEKINNYLLSIPNFIDNDDKFRYF